MKILLSSVLSFFLLATICQASSQMDLFYNEQRPGGDYAGLRVQNVDGCIQACESDRRCRAFDFNTEDRQCWLKDRIPQSRANRSVISGVKKGYRRGDQLSEATIGNMVIEQNSRRTGGDYKTFTARNAEECANACAQDKECKSFNYGRFYGDCWLKDTVPAGVENRGTISGYKRSSKNKSEEEGWTTGEVFGLTLENNTQRRGKTYKSSIVKNARACVKLCAADSSCKSFNYAKDSQECRLKETIPRARYNANIISGYKPQPSSEDVRTDALPARFQIDGLSVENNTRRYGTNYAKFTVNNVEDCARSCARGRMCKSFNYFKEQRICVLKETIPERVSDTGTISGYKPGTGKKKAIGTTVPYRVAGITLENNVKRSGGDYRNFTVKNVEECAIACANDKRCRSINYGKKNRDCWLKKTTPQGVYNQSVISGIKTQ